MTFHDDEHRINNTGWIRNGDETEEWNEKHNHWEDAERFSIYIFSIRNEAMSRICACKTERTLQMFGRCLQFKQSCLWATLSYFCLRKQGRKINAMRRVVFPKCIKKSSALSHIKYGEVSLQIEFATLPQKTTTSLWKRNEKGIGKTRKMRPQANNAQYNTQGWDMRGGEWRDSGRGGGWAAPLYQLIYEPGEMVWQYIYFSALI